MGKIRDIEGYDYEELLDLWGLRKKFKKLTKAINALEEIHVISMDDVVRMNDELGYKLIADYIGERVHTDHAGNTSIDADTLDDMLVFLQKLRNNAVVSPGDAKMYYNIALLESSPESMYEFYRWFVHCLPLMWN